MVSAESNSFDITTPATFHCIQGIQMSTLTVVPDLVREVVQFILITYSALEDSLPYWTVSTTRMR